MRLPQKDSAAAKAQQLPAKMANPRIEEVDDEMDDISDPEEMDVDAFDFARPSGKLEPAMDASSSQLSGGQLEQLLQSQSQSQPQQAAPPMDDRQRERLQMEQREKSKQYQCIYPVYFDSTRSREHGRRVKREMAVPNPLARDLVDALQDVGVRLQVPLQIVFEPAKSHPKDWANPGRVRVLVKKDGKAVNSKIKNSMFGLDCRGCCWANVALEHHLYRLISDYLKLHPTTEDSPMRLRIQGMPMPKEKIPPPAVPRGFKIGSILPLHSPALSGGGVSDNFFKDMMAEMGGQAPDPAIGGGGGQKKVKEKKKGK